MKVLENDEIIVFYEKAGENVLTRAILKDKEEPKKDTVSDSRILSYSLTTHKYTFTRDKDNTFTCKAEGLDKKADTEFESLDIVTSIYATVEHVNLNNFTITFTLNNDEDDNDSFFELLAEAMDETLNACSKYGLSAAILCALCNYMEFDYGCDKDKVINAIYNFLAYARHAGYDKYAKEFGEVDD